MLLIKWHIPYNIINKIVLLESIKKKSKFLLCFLIYVAEQNSFFHLTHFRARSIPSKTTVKGLFIMQFRRKKKNLWAEFCPPPPPNSYAEILISCKLECDCI